MIVVVVHVQYQAHIHNSAHDIRCDSSFSTGLMTFPNEEYLSTFPGQHQADFLLYHRFLLPKMHLAQSPEIHVIHDLCRDSNNRTSTSSASPVPSSIIFSLWHCVNLWYKTISILWKKINTNCDKSRDQHYHFYADIPPVLANEVFIYASSIECIARVLWRATNVLCYIIMLTLELHTKRSMILWTAGRRGRNGPSDSETDARW